MKIQVLPLQQKFVLTRISELGLREEQDMEIVDDEVENVWDVLMTVRQKKIDVVVATDTEKDRGMASHLFGEFPDLTLMVLGVNGGVSIEQRCLHRWTVLTEKKAQIFKALRFAVRHPCESNDTMEG